MWVKPETGHALDTLITTLSSVLPDVTLTDSKAVLGPQNFWLLPRKGMVSPWASKALDIVHRCGLTIDCFVLEKGCVLELHSKPEFGLHSFHDPLTQCVINDMNQFSQHFSFGQVAPAKVYPILQQ